MNAGAISRQLSKSHLFSSVHVFCDSKSRAETALFNPSRPGMHPVQFTRDEKAIAQPFYDNHTNPCEQKSGLIFSFGFDIFIISPFSPQIVEFLKTAKQK